MGENLTSIQKIVGKPLGLSFQYISSDPKANFVDWIGLVEDNIVNIVNFQLYTSDHRTLKTKLAKIENIIDGNSARLQNLKELSITIIGKVNGQLISDSEKKQQREIIAEFIEAMNSKGNLVTTGFFDAETYFSNEG